MEMIKKTILALAVISLVSCEKPGMDKDDDDDMKPCESVACESVPAQVQSAFKNKYPQNTAEKWFKQDDQGYDALFTQNNNKTLAQFDNSGNFKTENVTPVTAPPSGTPPPNQNHQQCACHGHHEKHRHPHPGILGFLHHKHHDDCNKEHHDKDTECHVILD